jgi:flagellar motor protein MotB
VLANARAAAVRDHLEQQGKVPRERLFLVEPKIDAADEPAAKGTPTRVDFSLK